MNESKLTRREVLHGSAAAAIGLSLDARQNAPSVRCGFVGVGGRGTALLQSVLKIPSVEITAICDIDPEHRKRACDSVQAVRNKRPDEIDDWKAILQRGDLTSIVTALPCYLHYPMYRDTLNARKHLYGEKPLCLSVKHADALVKQSESAGVVFQIGFQRRFSKLLAEGCRMVREGEFGAPFDGRGGRFSSAPYRKPGEWFSFREKSGDWMLEQAVHNWDAITWALGELPVSAFGAGRQDLYKDWDPQRDVSDYYTVTLNYKSGLSYAWVHSWVAPPDMHFSATTEELIGPKGGIDLSKGYAAYRGTDLPVDKKSLLLTADTERDSTLPALKSFFECVKSGGRPQVGVKEGRDATLVGLLVRKAVYERRVVTMDEILREG
jgi:myo-inositol 2-dehydrogenase/D-chiro-inositol 1-dehydrogenase